MQGKETFTYPVKEAAKYAPTAVVSVIPLVFAAHMQATVYAIAEKAADIVKKSNNL